MSAVDIFANVRRPQEPRPFSVEVLRAHVGLSMAELALQIGASTPTLYRWRSEGMTTWEADRAAITLGLHPCAVWPEWFAGAEGEE